MERSEEQSPSPYPRGWRALRKALSSWRTASVVLLSFSSGMPLGLVWIAIPDWMRSVDVDIRYVGLFTLAQAPWAFNVVWAPFMDRYQPPFLGRRRGWAVITQVALALFTMSLAGVGNRPEAPWVALALTFAIAFSAATQDVAIDAYAVDVLHPEEQGVAVGARIALYRAGMYVASALAISLAARISWALVAILLGLLFLPMVAITALAPEPEEKFSRPQSLREAVWYPFLGFLARHRALEILGFVLLFKVGDNLAQSLLRPFLIDMGYSADDRGIALGTIGLVATIGGAILGGMLTDFIGLGTALWLFGGLQIFSNLGYVLLANIPTNVVAMYGAMGFETLTQGLGTGAFSVLLLRMTQKRFSAAQYAMFSTLFGFGRIISGPVAGFTVDAIGWSWFFVLTIPVGIPGLLMLGRFVKPGQREPTFEVLEIERRGEASGLGLVTQGAIAASLALIGGGILLALMAALKQLRAHPEQGFDFLASLVALCTPGKPLEWIQLVGLFAFAVAIGLMAAATIAARRGAARDLVTG